jgi:ATP/maltotriose-dependent transcriptional regulator MalT
VGEPRALAVVLFFRGLAIGWPTGSEAASLPFFEQSLELSRIGGPRWATYFSLMSLGELARVNGDYARAEKLLNEGLALVLVEGERHGGFFIRNTLAIVALAKRELGKAEVLGREALSAALGLDNQHGTVMALDTLASVAAAAGHPRRAARLFGAADATRAVIGDFAYATVRPDREHGKAIALAALGDVVFEQHAAEGGSWTLEHAAVEARQREPASEDRAWPSTGRRLGLTQREKEVLRLVAEGVTNNEIAERLIIGEATVKRHMDNVFAKLGVSSRTAAATAVVRSGLI